MKSDCTLLLRKIDRELGACVYRSNGVTNYYKTWMWNNNVFGQVFRKIVATENSKQLDDKFRSE